MVIAIVLALTFGRDAVLQRVDTNLASLAASIEADELSDETPTILIRPLFALGTLPAEFAQVAARGGGTVVLDQDFRRSEQWRVLVAESDEDGLVLIGVPLDESQDALDLLGSVLWTTAGIVLFFVLAIGLGAGLWVQRRLVRINTTLNHLASGDLQARTGIERSRDDLDQLARRLDQTAAELERLVAQTRNLSASLAHDLRTPLARLRAKLETLPEGEERGAALEEVGRLSEIFDTIMRVARIEATHGEDGFEEVDLGELATELTEIFGPVVEDSGKQLELNIDAPTTIMADRNMLIQAIANLIQNAIVHGGQTITLLAEGPEIGVIDNGAGVDPAQYDEIIKPMVRLDAARESEGTGLGLALVRAVADRHNAELELSEHQPQGLRVALKFTDL
eukprot:g17441.t1